ncbi:MAG: dUTP diphosphatase [Acidobacteriota bacterium]
MDRDPQDPGRQQRVRVRVKKMTRSARLPSYAHAGDSGMDLLADEELVIAPGDWSRVRTGIALQLQKGTEAQVRPRSGLAAKHGVTVLNAPGTIDASYRGEIEVILINLGHDEFRVTPGTPIAQIVISPVLKAELDLVETLSPTKRGGKGFGSTG